MTPYEFISKWQVSELAERSASQQHFRGCAISWVWGAGRRHTSVVRRPLTCKSRTRFALLFQTL